MKTVAMTSALALTAVALASPSWAAGQYGAPVPHQMDRARVISVTPIVQQVAVPRQVCSDELVATQRQPSGAGALLGAIAGGAMGNAIGSGSGRAAATALGVFGGAVLGSNIGSGGSGAQPQTVRHCRTETAYENRTDWYSVVYEYAGREYTTQRRQDPGRYVEVQVQAAPEADIAPPQYAQPQYAPPSVRGEPVYVERQAYQSYPAPVGQTYYPGQAPAYEAGPSYAPLGVGLMVGALIGYGAHHGGGGHYRHGRRGHH